MIAVRLLAMLAAVSLSFVAALLAITSLAGEWDARADPAASFAPIAFCMAAMGALLGWIARAPGVAATVLFGLSTVGAAISLASLAPEFLKLRRAHGKEPTVFRLLSGNLYLRNPSGERAVAAMLERDADAVILQEASRRLAGPLAGLEVRYPHVAACAHAGLRIYAKSPIIAYRCNCARADTPRGRLLTATIALADDSTVTLATTHFSHPHRGDLQARERKALAAAMDGLDARRLILAGDFNTTPWSRGMRRQDRMLAPLRRWTIAWFTWPARSASGNVAWPFPLLPIDHVYAGPAWSQVRLRRVRIPGSDHFATEAAFASREPNRTA